MMKLWTNFYSYFNVIYNQAAETTRRTQQNPASLGRGLSDYLLLFVVPAVLSKLLKDALRPGQDDDDEDDNLLLALATEVASYTSGIMLGVREVSAVIAGSYGYEGPAGARAFAQLGKLVKQTQQGELDEALLKSINDVGGILFHYPSGQLGRSVAGIVALIEGRTENPAAPIVGPDRRAK